MAKPPTLDDFIDAQKTVLEWRLRRKYSDDPAGEEDLFTNERAAEELLIGVSTWYRVRKELDLEAPEKRNRRPLYTRAQIEKAREHLKNEGD